MSDNPTELLREGLTERGVEYEAYRDIKNRCITKWRTYHGAFVFFAVEKEGKLFVETASDTKHSAICTPEQAIAATLGSEPPYDELLRCLENDWHISASWDDLRKFWCIELTEEGVKLRDATHGTLTAEQVMAIAGKHQPDYCSDTHVCFDWQAIADELNAELGSGTCHMYFIDEYERPSGEEDYLCECSECGSQMWEPAHDLPLYCRKCGKAVKR